MRENRSAASGGRRTNEGVGSSFFRVQTLRPLRSISGVISMSPRGARWPPKARNWLQIAAEISFEASFFRSNFDPKSRSQNETEKMVY